MLDAILAYTSGVCVCVWDIAQAFAAFHLCKVVCQCNHSKVQDGSNIVSVQHSVVVEI